MLIDVLTLFPDYFSSALRCSMLKRAIEKNILRIQMHDIRAFAKDKHKSVDDKPYGGGNGMVLKGDVLIQAVQSLATKNSTVIYLSAQGALFNAKMAQNFALEHKHIILLCGHYEGVDERVIQSVVDFEVCIGDFVLTNGGPAALVFIDATSRFLEGFFVKQKVALQDTFHIDTIFEGPRYTRPSEIQHKGKILRVPEPLLSGDPNKVQQYNASEAKKKLKHNRPDLCR